MGATTETATAVATPLPLQPKPAAATSLPLVKSRLLDAAERWDQLAEEVERFALRPRRRNEMYY